LDFIGASPLSYGFMSSFHTLALASIDLLLALRSRGIYFIFHIWLELNLFQFWVICSLNFFTNKLVPNSISLPCMISFWRCIGIFKNGRCGLFLKNWIVFEALKSWTLQIIIEKFPSIFHSNIPIDNIIFYKSFMCNNLRCVTCTNCGRNICSRSQWDIGCLSSVFQILRGYYEWFFHISFARSQSL